VRRVKEKVYIIKVARHFNDKLKEFVEKNFYNNNILLTAIGLSPHPVAVVTLHINKHEFGYY
jgi:hypothetical protein